MGANERVPLSVTAPAPSPQTVCAGAAIGFSVTATGSSPFTYIWQHGGTNLSDGGSISGATTAALTIDPAVVADGGNYDVVVTDTFGQPITSATGSLTVNAIPGAPAAGNDGPICAGATLQLTASTVAGATYAWTGPNGFTSSVQNPSIAGATTAATGTYTVHATVSGCSSAAATTTATVHATPAPPTAANNGPICAGQTLQLTASTVAGATYAWTGPNGFASNVQNPAIPAATAAASGTYSVTVTVGGCASAAATTNATVSGVCTTPLAFYALPPCRVIDTRGPTGPLGGPALSSKATRTFSAAGHCGIPSSAQALSVNVTVTQSTAAGDLRLFAGGALLPLVSTINYGVGQTRANNAVVILGAATDLAVRCDQAAGTVQLVVDVNGYFQ